MWCFYVVQLFFAFCIFLFQNLTDRAKVLKHHPDKKNAVKIEEGGGEEYFTCITKAYEQLGISEQKRRAYDSVDRLFDDSIPDEKLINFNNFYDILAPVFIRNARFLNDFIFFSTIENSLLRVTFFHWLV